jgi:hypothetical protein
MGGSIKTLLILIILAAAAWYFFLNEKPCAEVAEIKSSITGKAEKFKDDSQKSADDKATKVFEKFFPVQ